MSTCSYINLKCEPDYSGRLMIASRDDLTPKNGTYPISSIIVYFILGEFGIVKIQDPSGKENVQDQKRRE